VSPNGSWSGADQTLAAALAAGQTVTAAAAAAAMSEQTAYRRLSEPAFRQHVDALRSALLSTAAGRLADGMLPAVDVLRALLASRKEDVRLRAAVKVIELGLKVAELADLEHRVAELERRAASTVPQPPRRAGVH
jgi:HEAT repeat protein